MYIHLTANFVFISDEFSDGKIGHVYANGQKLGPVLKEVILVISHEFNRENFLY